MANCGDCCSLSSSVESTQRMFDVHVCVCSNSRSQADGVHFRSLASCRFTVLMICRAIVGGPPAVMQLQMMKLDLRMPTPSAQHRTC